MRVRAVRSTAEQCAVLSMLLVAAVLTVLAHAGRPVGLCIVYRLTGRAVPGCVPAWSADRAPPRSSPART